MTEEEDKNIKPVLESENERLSPKTEEQNLSFFSSSSYSKIFNFLGQISH